MSKKSLPEFAELFDRSATPESPAELDGRILDYARRNAPQPTSTGYPLLLKGAATLSVACIGLLVVLRSGDTNLPTDQLPEGPPPARTVEQSHDSSVADSPARQDEAMPAVALHAAKKDSTSEQRQTNSRHSMLEREQSATVAARPRNLKRTPATKPGKVMGRRALPAPAASLPGAAETGESHPLSGLATIQSLEQTAAYDVLLNSEHKPDSLAKLAKTGVMSDEMRKLVRRIAKLHAAGKLGEAEKAYRELRERCKRCQLPDSLARALDQADTN